MQKLISVNIGYNKKKTEDIKLNSTDKIRGKERIRLDLSCDSETSIKWREAVLNNLRILDWSDMVSIYSSLVPYYS